jgi:hypothetical protein
MTDEFPDLEADLRRFTPAVPPGTLADRIARQLNAPPRHLWSDRCLTGAIALGLAASIVIVTLLGSDWIAGRSSLASTATVEAPMIDQTRELLTQLAMGYESPMWPSATAPN